MAPSTPIVSTDQRRQLLRSAVIAQGQEKSRRTLRCSAHPARLSFGCLVHMRVGSAANRGPTSACHRGCCEEDFKASATEAGN